MTKGALVCSLLVLAAAVCACAAFPTVSFAVAFGLGAVVGGPSGIVAGFLSGLGLPVHMMTIVTLAAVLYVLWTLAAITAAGRAWITSTPAEARLATFRAAKFAAVLLASVLSLHTLDRVW